MGIPLEEIKAVYDRGWRMAWVLGDVHKLNKPIPYHHRSGSQRWVIFDDQVRMLLEKAETETVGSDTALDAMSGDVKSGLSTSTLKH